MFDLGTDGKAAPSKVAESGDFLADAARALGGRDVFGRGGALPAAPWQLPMHAMALWLCVLAWHFVCAFPVVSHCLPAVLWCVALRTIPANPPTLHPSPAALQAATARGLLWCTWPPSRPARATACTC